MTVCWDTRCYIINTNLMKADSGVTYSDLTWIVYNSRAQTPAEVSQSRESRLSVREAEPNNINTQARHLSLELTTENIGTPPPPSRPVINVRLSALSRMGNRIKVFLLLFAIAAVKVGRLKTQKRFISRKKYFRPKVTTLNVTINPAFCVSPEITQHSIFPSDKSLI